MPVGPSRDQLAQYQRGAAVNGALPGGGFRPVDPSGPFAGRPMTEEEKWRSGVIHTGGRRTPTGFEGTWPPPQGGRVDSSQPVSPRDVYPNYMSGQENAQSNPYQDIQGWWNTAIGMYGGIDNVPVSVLQRLQAEYQTRMNAAKMAAGDDWLRYTDPQEWEYRQRQKSFARSDEERARRDRDAQRSKAFWDNRNRGIDASHNYWLQRQEQQRAGQAARRDQRSADKRWDDLMAMMQMLMGGGGNQITPPGGGGGSVGPYNLRPPQPGGYIQP